MGCSALCGCVRMMGPGDEPLPGLRDSVHAVRLASWMGHRAAQVQVSRMMASFPGNSAV